MRRSKRIRESEESESKSVAKKSKAIPSWLCDAEDCKGNCEVQAENGKWYCQPCMSLGESRGKACTKCGHFKSEIRINEEEYCAKCRPLCDSKDECFSLAEMKYEGKFMCSTCFEAIEEPLSKCECGKTATDYHEDLGHICADHVAGVKCRGCARYIDTDGSIGYCGECTPECDQKECHADAVFHKDGKYLCKHHWHPKCGHASCVFKAVNLDTPYEGKVWCDIHAKLFDKKTKKRYDCCNPVCNDKAEDMWRDVPCCSRECWDRIDESEMLVLKCKNCILMRPLSRDGYCQACHAETEEKKDDKKCEFRERGDKLVQCNGLELRSIDGRWMCIMHAQAFDRDGNKRQCYGVDCESRLTRLYGGVTYCSDECMESMLLLPCVHCFKCGRFGVGQGCKCDEAHCIRCCKDSAAVIEKNRKTLQTYLGDAVCDTKDCASKEVRIIGNGKKFVCVCCAHKYDKKGNFRKCTGGCGKDCTALAGNGLPVCGASKDCDRIAMKARTALCEKCDRIGVLKNCDCKQPHCVNCCKL